MDRHASSKSAYLAGPDVFFPNATAIGTTKKGLLLRYGITGIFPLDNEIATGAEQACKIFLGNVKLINQSSIVLANIVPFRGPSLDPGTAWEIGYAFAKGIPVICYGSSGTYLDRCRTAGLEGEDKGRDSDGLIIEDFGEQENIMITQCATLIVATFEEAVEAAARMVSGAVAFTP